MLVYYFGHVNGTLEQVSAAISAAEGEVSVWARLAYRKGEELRTRIEPGSFMPAKEVEILLGQPVARSGSVIIPMDWKATGPGALFPVMSADLVLQPLGTRFGGSGLSRLLRTAAQGAGTPSRSGVAASARRSKRQGLPGSVVPGSRGLDRFRWARGPARWFRARAGCGSWCRRPPFQHGFAGSLAPTRARRKQGRSPSPCR